MSVADELIAFVKQGAQITEYGPRATPEELANAPKGAESMMFRRPILYDSMNNEIHIGSPGEYHESLFKRGILPHGGMYYGSETIHPEETGIQFYNPQPPQEIKDQLVAHTGLPLLPETGFGFSAKVADSWDTRQEKYPNLSHNDKWELLPQITITNSSSAPDVNRQSTLTISLNGEENGVQTNPIPFASSVTTNETEKILNENVKSSLITIPEEQINAKSVASRDSLSSIWTTLTEAATKNERQSQKKSGDGSFNLTMPPNSSNKDSPRDIESSVETATGWPGLNANHKQSDSWDSRQFPDQASDPLPATHYEHEKDCTCEEGHKLDCPVHGLNADIDQGSKPWAWSVPEASPVGYPQDQPRSWQTPYTGKVADWHLNPPHYNRWTGELCHCPWSSNKRKMTRLAGEHMNKVLKTYQKAFQTPEGEQFLHNIQSEIPEEYESLLPYIVNRWRKGDIKPNPEYENRLTYNANPRWPEQTLVNRRLPSWHKWFEARQHPTRRGVDVMAKDFTPDKMDFRAQEHEQALQEEREQEAAKSVGKTVWHVPERPADIDWNQVYNDESHRGKFFRGYDEREESPEESYRRLKVHPGEDEQEEVGDFEQAYMRDARPKGWHIKHLTANENDKGQPNYPGEALECEGGLMGHCIGNDEQPYKRLADRGQIDAYSLRDPKGMPHVTWHYNNSDGSLAEIFGHKDSEVKPEYQQMIDEWGEHSGNETTHPVGNMETPGDEYIMFPQANFVSDYIDTHHPEYYYETAEHYGDYDPEHTQIEQENPDWESVAYDYYHNPPQGHQARAFQEALENNSWTGGPWGEERGHKREFNEALEQVRKEEEPEPDPNEPTWLQPRGNPPLPEGQQPLFTPDLPQDWSGESGWRTTKKAAQHWQNWEPGKPGKWAKEKDGKIIAWQTYADGWPHHYDMIMPSNLTGALGQISPAGVITGDYPETPLPALEEVAKTHPALSVPEAELGGGGFFGNLAEDAPGNDEQEQKKVHGWNISPSEYNVKEGVRNLNPGQQPLGWPWEINTPVEDILFGKQGVIRDLDEPGMKAYVDWGQGLNGSWTNATSLQPKLTD